MTVVTTLPRPPSRINSPATFVVDSSLFLDRLNVFKREVNDYSLSINRYGINVWNLGGTVSKLLPPPTPEVYLKPNGVGLTFIFLADTLYSNIYKNVSYYNSLDVWVQGLVKELGKGNNRHVVKIPQLTPPQRRDQEPDKFNTEAISFTQSNIDNTTALHLFSNNVWESVNSSLDLGSVIDEELVRFVDCGWVSDKEINNDEVVDFYHLSNFKTNKLRKQIIKTTTEVFIK